MITMILQNTLAVYVLIVKARALLKTTKNVLIVMVMVSLIVVIVMAKGKLSVKNVRMELRNV
ncbi:MAG: hypothetical protein NTX03_09235 [Bacteroidetes bacterium]|nr:hypothetical protein [Bacteroidota bacterium]